LNNRSAVIELVLFASEWNYKSADILKGVFVSLFELRYFVSSVADLHLTLLLYMLERSNISVLNLSFNISLVEVYCLYTCIDLCFRVL
jgi:hypothetical protein